MQRSLKEKTKQLDVLCKQVNSAGKRKKVKELRKDINELLEKDEIMWKQRARVMWLEAGDRNSSYFHRKASARQTRNNIKGLEDMDGVWQEDEQKIEEIAVSFFKNLFTTKGT